VALDDGTLSAGAILREWRERRRLTQRGLALQSAVSARHLSFIETGRARPSREMLLHLAERLEVPLRERNRLLLAAGFAPVFGERSLEAREMAPVREALERFLTAHDPYPALVVDRHGTSSPRTEESPTSPAVSRPNCWRPRGTCSGSPCIRRVLHRGLAIWLSGVATWLRSCAARCKRRTIRISNPFTRNFSLTRASARH
jgi:transcriptional regulator with XRE-family HTH domain